jgi:CheY-like chemotaxis protein
MMSKNLLAIDDHRDITTVITTWVRKNLGAEVTQAASFNEAVSLMRKLHFDLVVCEQDIPDGSGDQMFDLIESMPIDEQPHFIVFTGNKSKIQTPNYSERFIVVEKPNWSELFEAIELTGALA